jgi:hypothetical protein
MLSKEINSLLGLLVAGSRVHRPDVADQFTYIGFSLKSCTTAAANGLMSLHMSSS